MTLSSNIEGVKIFKKNVITDERGKILHMLKRSDENFIKFGKFIFLTFFQARLKHGIYIKK